MCSPERIAETLDGSVEWCGDCRSVGIAFGNIRITRLSPESFLKIVRYFQNLDPYKLPGAKDESGRRYVSFNGNQLMFGFQPEEFILLEGLVSSAQNTLVEREELTEEEIAAVYSEDS